MQSLDRANLISIFYGSILVISLELLFLILVPRMYPIVNTFPLLFLSQVLRVDLFLYTLIISSAFFLLLFVSNFYNDLISFKLLLNFFTISIIVFFFSILLNKSVKNKFKNEKIIVYTTFFTMLVMGLLSFFFFTENEQNQLREYLNRFTDEFFKLKDISSDIDTSLLIETVVNVMPSINVFSFLLIFFINFNITKLVVNKLNFHNLYNFNIFEFEIPKIIFLAFNILFILSALSPVSFNYLFLNLTIALSFLIFYEGFVSFFNSFKKLEIHNFLKIIIIFLLFIFLGYVLFLILFLLGFFLNLKKIAKGLFSF